MHGYVQACVHLSACVCGHVGGHVCIQECVSVYVQVCAGICVHLCTGLCAVVYACVCVWGGGKTVKERWYKCSVLNKIIVKMKFKKEMLVGI